MNYTVIFNPDLKVVINQVNVAISQGFKPLGGIVVVEDKNSPTGKMFLQSMSK